MARNRLKFRCLPTAIGSMPDSDAEAACRRVFAHLRDIPVWPQLPKRATQENMYLQFSEGFPGASVEGEHIYVEKTEAFDSGVEKLYGAYLDGRTDEYGVSPDFAAGLHAFLGHGDGKPRIVKGQVIGPISFGLVATDRQGRGIVYDDTVADVLAKFLRLKAAWQEKALRQMARDTIIFVDEPYLTSLGSAFVSIPRERVVDLIGEVLCGIEGVSGVHCCGGTDWTLLLSLPVDVLSFDAYNYAGSLALYPAEVKTFLSNGGTIAWGVVPDDEDALAGESVASLYDRLGEAIAPFTRNGISFNQVLEQSLLTPSCGLASLSSDAADGALGLLADLSEKARQRL